MKIGEVPLRGNVDNYKDLPFVVAQIDFSSLSILKKDKEKG